MANESPPDLAVRTKAFALRIIKLYSALPKKTLPQVLATQVLRSGTSVGAQYREARRARSTAEFISKMVSSLQELDETSYWLELFVDAAIIAPRRLELLQKEAQELTAIFGASVATAKRRRGGN